MRSNNTSKLATNQSMGATFASNGVDTGQIVLLSIQAVWTGSPVGSFKLQISNDDVPVAVEPNKPYAQNPSSNVVNWTDYTGSTTAVSGAGDFMWNILESGYRWIRVVYTRTSGTGTCNITCRVKGV